MDLESGRSEQPKDPLFLAQIALAQMAFGAEDHKKAMEGWLAGGDSSLAAHFRAYVESHPDEPIEPHDAEAMRELLKKIRTLH